MRTFQILLFLAFLALIVIFAFQNPDPIAVRFLAWELKTPVPIFIVGIYLLGMLSGWSVLGFIRRSIRRAAERPERSE